MTPGDRFSGLILGTAVGDALGLPFEGLGRRRIARLHEGRWRHRFLFGRGFVSDDTDHTLLVALSLIAAPRARERFQAILARRLRWWLAGLPLGAGRATYLSILRLWLGFGPERSGIHSAGNGPAMRSALIGAFFADDRVALDAYVEASTRITHTDPRALVGARAVALVAALIVATDSDRPPEIDALDAALRSAGEGDAAWSELCDQIRRASTDRISVGDFAGRLGLGDGVSGFIYHTVPVAIYAWLAHWGDYEATVSEVMACGGDTDTVAAITGALAGATTGEDGVPKDWIDGLAAWPHGVGYMRRVAARLEHVATTGSAAAPPACFWPLLPIRNLLGNYVALAHLAKRFGRSG